MLVLVSLAGALAVSLAVVPPARGQEIVDRIVATVNDEVITLSDFYTAMPIFLQLNQVPASTYASVEGRRALATRLLQELVNRELLDQQADRHELEVESSAVNGYIELMARQNGATLAELRQELEANGIAYEDFYEYIRLELTKLRVINVLVTSGVTVSDAEVDAAFLERYPDGAVERRYDIHQILLIPPHGASPEQLEEVRQQLEAIRQRALRGESFEDLARTYSQDASRRRDGHMGSYRQGQLPRAFEEQVFNLMEGEISEVFQTRFGFHIIRLNRLWDEPTVDIDAVREEIYRELQLAKQNREIERYMVQLHEDNIIQLQFDPSTLF